MRNATERALKADGEARGAGAKSAVHSIPIEWTTQGQSEHVAADLHELPAPQVSRCVGGQASVLLPRRVAFASDGAS